MLPYRAISDYQALQGFARSHAHAPVLVSYRQYYELLASVVAPLRAALVPDGPVLVEMSRPLGIPVPRELLAEGIVLCDDAGDQAQWWKDTGIDRFLVVRTRIRRDLHEFGDNALMVTLYTRADRVDPLPRLMDAMEFRGAFAAGSPEQDIEGARQPGAMEEST